MVVNDMIDFFIYYQNWCYFLDLLKEISVISTFNGRCNTDDNYSATVSDQCNFKLHQLQLKKKNP